MEDEKDVMDMPLCEAKKVVLRVGQLYRFRPVEGCESCARDAREAHEAYGADPAQ